MSAKGQRAAATLSSSRCAVLMGGTLKRLGHPCLYLFDRAMGINKVEGMQGMVDFRAVGGCIDRLDVEGRMTRVTFRLSRRKLRRGAVQFFFLH